MQLSNEAQRIMNAPIQERLAMLRDVSEQVKAEVVIALGMKLDRDFPESRRLTSFLVSGILG